MSEVIKVKKKKNLQLIKETSVTVRLGKEHDDVDNAEGGKGGKEYKTGKEGMTTLLMQLIIIIPLNRNSKQPPILPPSARILGPLPHASTQGQASTHLLLSRVLCSSSVKPSAGRLRSYCSVFLVDNRK